jgi:DNA polymerase III delta prime subunit
MTRQYNNHGHDQINIEQFQGNLVIHERKQASRSRTEALLLQAVKEEIVSRLGQSLNDSLLINLSKEFQPRQVNRAWEVEVKTGSKPSELIPSEISILEIFDRSDIAGKLLILGDPGSGKTTTLLDLAESLLSRAEETKDYPIPVLFSLSSWKDDRQKIEDWLVAELNFKYGVKVSVGRKWLQDRRLLLLLDGLDELEASRQELCIQAINKFLTSQVRPLHVTVCSRRLEYEINNTKLLLNGAIFLQALSDEQVQSYLEKTGFQTLKQNFAIDSEIWALFKSPLLLTLTVLAYQEISLRDWQGLKSTDERKQYLLDAYIRRMFDRPIKHLFYKMKNEPTQKQSQQWLTYLAKRLNAESQTELFIERIQPTWLSSPIQKMLYCLLGAFFGAILGCLVFGLSGLFFGKAAGIIFSSIGTLTTGLGINLNGVNIKPVERLKLSTTNLRKRMLFGLTSGLICGLVFWVCFDYFIGAGQGKMMGISSGLTVGLINFLYGGLSGPDIAVKSKPNQGIRDSLKNARISGLSLFLLFGLIGGVSGNPRYSIPGALIGGLSGWLIGGGLPTIQHFALRIVLWVNGYIPWNYARFLNYANERMLLQRTGGSYRFIHNLIQERLALYAGNKDK